MTNTVNEKSKINSVSQKIFNIASKELYVQKTGWNGHHKYKYATEKDVVEAVRTKLTEQKLVYHFSVLNSEQINTDVIRVTYEFTLIDIETGDTFACTVIADGQDKGDKAPYKAFTGAQKYFFMKLFLIATGDDPESTGEQAPEEDTTPKLAPRTAVAPAVKTSRFTRTETPPATTAVVNESDDEEVDSDLDTEAVIAEAERKVSRFSRGTKAEAEAEPETTLKTSRTFKPGQRFNKA